MKRAWFFLLVPVFVECARPVMPSGGPKDVTPPIPVEAVPENYSVNFSSSRIVIGFHEFINLKDPRKEIFISPPMDKFPEFRVRGKNLIITLEEQLKENTTYTIFFGNSIIDITENNPRANYEYVFSTGSSIDSLTVLGSVIESFTLRPEENILVMLYFDNNDTILLDSLPLYAKPYYASRTDVNGNFRLNNLKDETYKVFALEDKNSNYTYDQPNERIAFLDSLIRAGYIALPDTLAPPDTVESAGFDVVVSDSLVVKAENFYELRLFDEIDSIQRLTESNVVDKGRFRLGFRFPPEDLRMEVLHPDSVPDEWYLTETNRSNDTITYWMKDFAPDTLIIKLEEKSLDADTIRLVFNKGYATRRDRKKQDETPRLRISTNISNRNIDFDKPLRLGFSEPVAVYGEGKIRLIRDTLEVPYTFRFTDEIKRQALIDHKWDQNSSYTLLIPDSVFTGLQGASHDTVELKFNTLGMSDYGSLILTLAPESLSRFVIYLLGPTGAIVDEYIVSSDTTIERGMLNPGKYRIKAFRDDVPNGRWDPGNYSRNRQPEFVYFFPVEIEIRPNWSVKETWLLP